MKLLSLSGGGTKIAALTGAAISVIEDFKYKPNVIVGTSAGGLMTLPLAMGLHQELKNVIFNLTLGKMFNIKPVNKKGKIRLFAALRMFFGKQSLGKQDNLIKTIASIITKERFEEYKKGSFPDVYIVAVDFKTGSRKYFNVKTLNYETYLKVVNATSAIPFFVESVNIQNGIYYDGSLRDHIGSHKVMEILPITENVSIYSRPHDYNIVDNNWKPKNVIKVLERTTEIMLMEISKNDELKEDNIAKEKNIKNTKIFIPHIKTKSSYDLNSEKLKDWYEIGKKAALTFYMKKK